MLLPGIGARARRAWGRRALTSGADAGDGPTSSRVSRLTRAVWAAILRDRPCPTEATMARRTWGREPVAAAGRLTRAVRARAAESRRSCRHVRVLFIALSAMAATAPLLGDGASDW